MRRNVEGLAIGGFVFADMGYILGGFNLITSHYSASAMVTRKF